MLVGKAPQIANAEPKAQHSLVVTEEFYILILTFYIEVRVLTTSVYNDVNASVAPED